MFEAICARVLCYGSEVWGYVNGDEVEVVHTTLLYLRTCILRVKNQHRQVA
jgi:hypothetical protein